MSVPRPTPIELTPEAARLVEAEAARTRRSRSGVVEDLVRRHLRPGAEPADIDAPARKREEIAAMIDEISGAAARVGQARSAEEIDAEIRWLRGDD